MNVEEVKKYLPWAIGAVVVVGGIVLYRNGTLSGSGSSDSGSGGFSVVTPAPVDTSATTAANAQILQSDLQARLQGFGALVGYAQNKVDQGYAFQTNESNNRTALALNRVNANAQTAAINAQARAQNSHDNASIISAIGSAAIFALLL